MVNPTISLQTAWELMNMLDADGEPIPFSLRFTYSTTDEKDLKHYGVVGEFKDVILARNVKHLDAEIQASYNPADSEIIYARDWKFYLPATKEIKSLSHWHITHLNDMEINFPKTQL